GAEESGRGWDLPRRHGPTPLPQWSRKRPELSDRVDERLPGASRRLALCAQPSPRFPRERLLDPSPACRVPSRPFSAFHCGKCCSTDPAALVVETPAPAVARPLAATRTPPQVRRRGWG